MAPLVGFVDSLIQDLNWHKPDPDTSWVELWTSLRLVERSPAHQRIPSLDDPDSLPPWWVDPALSTVSHATRLRHLIWVTIADQQAI